MEEKNTSLYKSALSYDKITNITQIASSVGLLAGLVYAFKNNKGFWAYVGYGMLGSIAFGLSANITSKILIK
jgi:hypothetical protein